MRKLVSAILISTSVSAPLAAAEDVRLGLGNQRDSSVSTGVGAQASVRIKLGNQRTIRNAERVALSLAAGPAFARQSGDGLTIRRGVSPVAGLSIRPGYSTSFTLAGRPVATRYTKLGLAEAQESGKTPKGPRNGVSTLGWVGIGVGAIVAVILIAAAVCTDNNDPCEIAGD